MLHCAPIMHCTLLVPDLLPPGLRDAPPPRAPRLATLLARAGAGSREAGGMEAWLCGSFGVARQHDWPVAALTLAVDGDDPADAYWLRCDPVHFYLRQNRLHLSNAAGAPAEAESRALIAALNTHFQNDGLHFRAGAEGRWYVRSDGHTDLATQALADSLGRSIDNCLPAGADSGHWRSVLNEIQMLLHAHPVNAARETRGLPAFNSVWLWGGGLAPRIGTAPFTKSWADDALARALATRCGTPVAPVPPDAAAVLAAGGTPLVVITTARDASGDGNAWRNALEHLERDWFAPCHAALRRRQLAQLTLVATDGERGRRFVITARDLWRWWRRPRSLDAYA